MALGSQQPESQEAQGVAAAAPSSPSAGTILFDYDGTLHDTNKVYAPAFRACYQWLVEQGHAQPREFTDEWIGSWLGWTVQDMWTTFMPELPESVWWEASHIVGVEMERLAQQGACQLYPSVPEALDQLVAQGYTLAVLSNCGRKYRDAHRGYFDLDRWFSAYYVAEDYPGLKKWQIFQEIAPSLPAPYVMVGDRFHDIEVATKAGIPSIGCLFGYGEADELSAASLRVESFDQIPAAVQSLLG